VTAGKGVDLKREGPHATRAIVLNVEFKGREPASDRDAQSRLDEAVGLASAIDLDILDRSVAMLAEPRPATLIGKGKVDELARTIKGTEAELVVVNAQLSPIQQRNLEQAWKAKVLDRTGLILEIFGRRARTREGTLQVELAHLQYQKSRLVRSWTHLERQRGGFGFLGGPGERQLEADRRLIEERITRIRSQLESVVKTRALHRKSRARVPYPVVALVGYTNAGKSTLFNALTKSRVLAKDLLFATLDPAMRQLTLPQGRKIILSDTVGFIADLPTSLIAAFRATLEEVISADIILHVRDVSHAESESQSADVTKVLDELGIDEIRRARMIEVWNKADLLGESERARFTQLCVRRPGCVLVSSLDGEGLDRLNHLIEARLAAHDEVYEVFLDPADGKTLAWLHERAEVLDRRMFRDGRLCVTVRLGEERRGQAERRFGRAMRPVQEQAAAAE
jgi:GTP-binding protein HflX